MLKSWAVCKEAKIVTHMERVPQNTEERCLQEQSARYSAFSSSFPSSASVDKSHFSQFEDEGKRSI